MAKRADPSGAIDRNDPARAMPRSPISAKLANSQGTALVGLAAFYGVARLMIWWLVK
jgi:hypothetical protein